MVSGAGDGGVCDGGGVSFYFEKKIKIVFIDFSIVPAFHSKTGKNRKIRESFFSQKFEHLNT